MAVRATVKNGRHVVDEPTQLPGGTVVDLALDDDGEPLDEAKRRALDTAISASLEQVEAGNVAPAVEVLARLRARRLG